MCGRSRTNLTTSGNVNWMKHSQVWPLFYSSKSPETHHERNNDVSWTRDREPLWFRDGLTGIVPVPKNLDDREDEDERVENDYRTAVFSSSVSTFFLGLRSKGCGSSSLKTLVLVDGKMVCTLIGIGNYLLGVKDILMSKLYFWSCFMFKALEW